MSKSHVGKHIKRFDLSRYLTGKALYIDDIKLPGMVHAHFVRSVHAHARIERVDYSEALRLPGVLGAWTYNEVGPRVKGIKPFLDSENYRVIEWPHLASGKVRYVGECVAVIVATDRYCAEDAAELVQVDYLPLAPLSNAETSINNSGDCLHEELKDNILFELKLGAGDVDKAFQEADLRVERDFKHSRCTGLAIENRGVVAQYDPTRRFLTVWSSTQVPDFLRSVLAECLEHPENRIRVIAPDVGGGFGVKMHIFPEELVLSFLAQELGKPVKWIEDRRENLMASTHAREHTVHAEIAARKDGTILAIRAEDLSDIGAYSVFPSTGTLETLTFASILTGPYKLENFSFHGKAVATTKAPTGAYRGVGFVLVPLVMEVLLDLVARSLDMDPAEVRRRNYLGPVKMPCQAPTGIVYDSGNYPEVLERVLALGDYQGWRKKQSELRAQGRFIGIGLSSFIEPTGMGRRVFRRRGMAEVPGFDSARIKVDPSGTVRAFLSTPSQGQGQETTFAQILADEMGVSLEDISISLGDTDSCPIGCGTFSSRSIVSAGSALALAARDIRQKLLSAAGHMLQVSPDELRMEDSEISVKHGGGKRLSLGELTRAIYSPLKEFPNDGSIDFEVTRSFSVAGAAISYGTHMAIVEVDPETGVATLLRYFVVEDCGKIINPAIVDGQVRGGVAQGIGTALYEHLQYDAQGQILTASLMDYMAPGPTEVPTIEIEHLEIPSPLTPMGGKGVGESGTIASPAAIANAISDALAPFQVSFSCLPVTPQEIVAAVQEHSLSKVEVG